MTMRRNALLSLVLVVAALVYVSLHSPGFAARRTLSSVSVVWGNSTVLASWAPTPGASAYLASLVRVRDSGIMEQKTLPASETTFDGQGLWPDEQYFVGIQPLDAAGSVLATEVSPTGESTPSIRSQFNGFFDDENVADGQVNTTLWDVRLGADNPPNQGGTFVNDQLHFHITSADQNEDQTFTSMRARVPIDWTNRTTTIHGEVDLHGDFFNWFAVLLTPTPTNGDAIIDNVDRPSSEPTSPQLELFNDQDGVHLFDCQGGTNCVELGTPFTHVMDTSNVRDTILWAVSSTHLTVTIDGETAFNVAIPPTSFTHGYMTLVAENYPGNTGGVHKPTPADVFGGELTIWHLDNWGFDAASNTMPAVDVSYTSGCGPSPSAENQTVTFSLCGELDNTGFGWNGQPTSVTLQAPDPTTVKSRQLVMDAKGLHGQDVTVSVNGHTPIPNAPVLRSRNLYAVETTSFPIPAGELVTGNNTFTFKQVGGTQYGTPQVGNMQLESVLNTPFVVPPYPTEPAPIGQWGPPGPPQPSPTPTSTPTPMPINNVPCTVTLPSGQETGTCTGTFTPNP